MRAAPDRQLVGARALLHVLAFVVREEERLLAGDMRFGDAERFARVVRLAQSAELSELATIHPWLTAPSG